MSNKNQRNMEVIYSGRRDAVHDMARFLDVPLASAELLLRDFFSGGYSIFDPESTF